MDALVAGEEIEKGVGDGDVVAVAVAIAIVAAVAVAVAVVVVVIAEAAEAVVAAETAAVVGGERRGCIEAGVFGEMREGIVEVVGEEVDVPTSEIGEDIRTGMPVGYG